MPNKNKEKQTKKLSIELHQSIVEAVEEIAMDENRSYSAQLRSFVLDGLKSHGIKVRGNQVVNNNLPAG